MITATDNFLSEEDLDLRNLSEEELLLYWNTWLEQAQATNDADADSYSNGVFVLMNSNLPTAKDTGSISRGEKIHH